MSSSWQAYIDSTLIGSGNIDKACIMSAAGDSVWASSPGFDLKPEEMLFLSVLLSDRPAKASHEARAQSEGIHVCGERYVYTKLEDGTLQTRKGKTGVIASKTQQAILVCHYPESVHAGNANQTVAELAEYLIKLTY